MYWKTELAGCKMEVVDSFEGLVDMDYYENNSKDYISFDVYADELEKYGFFQGQAVFEECAEKRILDMKLKTRDKVELTVYMASEKDAAKFYGQPEEEISKDMLFFVDIEKKLGERQ